MSTIAKCEELATKLGATLEDDGFAIRLQAPHGKTVDVEVHEYVYDRTNVVLGSRGIWREVWSDLRRFERDGFDECELYATLTCDWCSEVTA
jgi:hypothetical protein